MMPGCMKGKWRQMVAMSLTFFLMMNLTFALFINPAVANGEETLIRTGFYSFSVPANGGNQPDNGATGLIPASAGVLMDGSESTYAGWMGQGPGTPGTVQIAIDLTKDYPLEKIRLVLHSPNQFWGFKELTMKYRSEDSPDFYYMAVKHVREGNSLQYSITVPMNNKKARFIVIDIKRSHQYQHIPLAEVEIYRGTGEEGQNPSPPYSEAQLREEMKKDALMVDKYGQWLYEDWPGKVVSDEQLRQEYDQEADRLSQVELDTDIYDRYGGIKSGGQYGATGFFRLQKIDGVWWFITPEGHKFFMKGVDAASIWEWGYGTPLKKEDGTMRRVFEELPDPVAYAPAYANDANGERVSFVIANVMKKYGDDFETKWEEITRKRLIDWGFNAFSKWTRPRNILFPYIQVLQDPEILRRIQWTYDVFDPANESIIEQALKPILESKAEDPWLIGYTYDNEAGWNADIVKDVLSRDSSSPAKNAFVNFMASRYQYDLDVVNGLLGTSVGSFNELRDIPIDIARVPSKDVSEFIKLAAHHYFTTVTKVIRKYDKNHLFLGTSIVPTWRTSLEWDEKAMEFVDAFSVDNYTNDAGWISRYESFDKPLLNLEFSFGTSERGLSPVNAATKVDSVAERGIAYQAFVERQAAHPLFVGFGWFSYYDQAVPGRRDGENFNIGLVNQQDQPYYDMINIVKSVNAGLERIHERASFQTDPEPGAIRIEAEQFDASSGGIKIEPTSDVGGGQNIADLHRGEWVAYHGIDLTGIDSMSFRVASVREGTVRVRIDGPEGPIIGTLEIKSTGGWQNWITTNIPISPVDGIHDLYLTFERLWSNETIGNINYFLLPAVYEAEEAVLDGAVPGNQHAGYSGTGYVEMANSQAEIEWTVHASEASLYKLIFRYTNGGLEDRFLKVAVNGVELAQDLKLSSTVSRELWSTAGLTVALLAGANTVRVASIDADGVNIDYLTMKLVQDEQQPADSEKPVWPAGARLTVADAGFWSVDLSWEDNPASDNSGVAGYQIYVDGVFHASVTGTVYRHTVTGLSPNSVYTFTVTAHDAVGNESDGLSISASTLPPSVIDITQPAPFSVPAGTSRDALPLPPTVQAYLIDSSWLIVDVDWNNGSPPYDPSVSATYEFEGELRLPQGVTNPTGLKARVKVTVLPDEPETDAEKPVWPPGARLVVTGKGPRSVDLSWESNPAIDNAGVAGYRVYVDGAYHSTVADVVYRYTVTGLNPNTWYTFAVKAFDEAGNESDPLLVSAETLQQGGSAGEVYVPSGNADLSVLLVRANGRVLQLTPAFSPGITVYSVQTDAERVELQAIAADAKAQVTVLNRPAAAGIEVELQTGETRLQVIVRAENGTTKTYTVIIHRLGLTPDERSNQPSDQLFGQPEEPAKTDDPPNRPDGSAVFPTDIAGHWAENEILYANGIGIVAGYPDGTFRPDSPATRAEFVAMLVKALGVQGDGSSDAFSDVPAGHWAQRTISIALQNGIATGYADGTFRPNALVTRAEMAVMIARALGLNVEGQDRTGFDDDAEIPQWAKGAIEALRLEGLVAGRGGNRFAPNEPVTRAEAVVMMLRILEYHNA